MNIEKEDIAKLVVAHVTAMNAIFNEWPFTHKQKMLKQAVLMPFVGYFPDHIKICAQCGMVFDVDHKLGMFGDDSICYSCELEN